MREANASSSSFVPKLSIYRSSGSNPAGRSSTENGFMTDRPHQWAGSSSDANNSTYNRYNNNNNNSTRQHDTTNTTDSINTHNIHTNNTMNDMSGMNEVNSPGPRNTTSAFLSSAQTAAPCNPNDSFTDRSRPHISLFARSSEHSDAMPHQTPWQNISSPERFATRTAPREPPAHTSRGAPTSSLLSSSLSTSEGSSSLAESTLFNMDAESVVPSEVLADLQTHAYPWARHARHTIVLGLLRARGMVLPRHVDLVEYHMSETFLNYIDLCCQGAYFVRYQVKRTPHERYFSIRMLPRALHARVSEKIPYITWTMHREGVQVIGCLPLSNLVGVTVNARSAAFRAHLASQRLIYGTREGSHRVKLPMDGALSLWFFDHQQRTATSLDLLTCNPAVLDVWASTFKGIVSVNSSSVVQMPLTSEGMSVEMEKLSREVQQHLASGSS